MADTGKQADIAKMSFEDALAELEGIVNALEGGKSKLRGRDFGLQAQRARKAH